MVHGTVLKCTTRRHWAAGGCLGRQSPQYRNRQIDPCRQARPLRTALRLPGCLECLIGRRFVPVLMCARGHGYGWRCVRVASHQWVSAVASGPVNLARQWSQPRATMQRGTPGGCWLLRSIASGSLLPRSARFPILPTVPGDRPFPRRVYIEALAQPRSGSRHGG